MAKYLLEVNYTLDGMRGVKAHGGSARVAATTELIESIGGKLESFNFALGATDVYVVADFPDNVSAVAALAVCAGGGATARTVPLLTAAEVDSAAAKNSTYRPPAS